MTITIANQKINSFCMLSEKAKTILQWVPKAEQWINQAINSDQTQISTNNENELVVIANSGLHGGSLIYIPELKSFFRPEKFFDMSTNDLRDLYCFTRYGNTGNGLPNSIENIIEKYHILSNDNIQTIIDHQQNYTLTNLPLFQFSGIEEKSFLATLPTNPDPNNKSASQWALSKSRSVKEYSQYFSFYQTCLEKIANIKRYDQNENAVDIDDENENGNKNEIESRIDTLYQSLANMSNRLLNSPYLNTAPDAEQLAATLSHWLSNNKHLGFVDQGTAMNILSQVMDISNLDQQAIIDNVQKALNKMSQFFKSTQAIDASPLQFDAGWSYFFKTTTSSATLIYDAQKCLSISRFNDTTQS